MRRRYWLIVALLMVAPLASEAQSTATTPATIGVGAHGNDWMIGTWSCVNTMPSPIGGPASSTLTFASSGSPGSLLFRSSGAKFDATGYLVYVPATKTWLNPFTIADGSYGRESTTQTGKKIVYTGTFYNEATAKTMVTRDTYTTESLTKQTDLGEYQVGGAWKALYNTTCTKS
jgi:hypothetical protein